MIKLTKAQRAALELVGAGVVSYTPGRTSGAHSNWTRYSYEALVGSKFAKRTKSVDALVNLGLADLAGSNGSGCPVVLTAAGREMLGVSATPLNALQVKVGRHIIAANGAVARVIEFSSEGNVYDGGPCTRTFRLAVGDFCFSETFDVFAPVPVLS
jgi:hypothetical protein